MVKKIQDEKSKGKQKRVYTLLSLIVVLFLASFLTYFLAIKFYSIAKNGEEFRDFIQSYGAYGIIVALGIQIIQVFIALIPGEFVEIGMGYAYGWLEATILSLSGVAIGSSLIFLLVKKFGIRLVEVFVSTDKINQLKIIKSEEKLNRLTFILYFIPGTPKDLLTYFISLTRMTLKDFLGITIFARIPSVVSSTVGGNLIGNGEYLNAVILFVITGVVSLAGIKLYKFLLEKLRKKTEKKGYLFKSFHKHENDV